MAGVRNYVELFLNVDTVTSLYVVRLRPGLAQDRGNYQAVGGIRLVQDTTSSPPPAFSYCVLSPLIQEVDQLIADTLTPSVALCNRPEKTCAGPDMSDPVPLESELSSEGGNDGYESSWRVYLQRAKEAAARADQLGEDLIEKGLGLDGRIESAEEDLEKICGGAINLASTFPSDMSGARGTSNCLDSQEGQLCYWLGPGMVCKNRACVRDQLATIEGKAKTDASAARLSQCLSDSGVIDYVTLGSRPMCIWRDKSTGRICEQLKDAQGEPLEDAEGNVMYRDCPFPAEHGTCAPGVPTDRYEMRLVTETLDLFDEAKGGKRNTEDPPPCAALRDLRDTGLDTASYDKIVQFLDLEKIRDIARTVGWEARVDDYSVVKINDKTWFSTGDAEYHSPPESTEWPCARAGATDQGYPERHDKDLVACTVSDAAWPELAPSLFCGYTAACGAAGDRTHRAVMNHRLGRAVLALKVITGVPVDSTFQGPFLPSLDWLHAVAGHDDSCCESWSNKLKYTKGGTPELADGRGKSSASSGTYQVVEDDLIYNDEAKLAISGKALCISSSDPARNIIWTDVTGPLLAGLFSSSVQRFECGVTNWPMMFKKYPGKAANESGNAAIQVWAGLGGLVASGREGGLNGLLKGVIDHPNDHLEQVKVAAGRVLSGQIGLYNFYQFDPDDYSERLSQYWSQDVGGDLNTIGVAEDGLRPGEILDGLELACEAARREKNREPKCQDVAKLAVQGLDDLGVVEDSLNCVANNLLRRAENEVLTNLPRAAKDGIQPAYQFEGERGAAAGEFGSAIIAMRDHQRVIDSTLMSFASDVRMLKLNLAHSDISSEMANLDTLAKVTTNIAACAGSFDIIKDATSFGLHSAVACTNAAAQIGFALEMNSLQGQALDLKGDMTWEEYKTRFRSHAETLEKTGDELEKAGTLMRASLARIETQRAAGRRALGKAIMLGSDAAGRQFSVNTVMRRRYNTLRVRYERAREDAVELAWIARRAVEQKLGLSLAGMREDMQLVEAPARWADSLCATTGIDYERIRQENGLDVSADHYADAFIGDYVRKLEQVVYSYEHDFPFNDARDTAVVSLRDDISSARAECQVSVPNLLSHSAHLDIELDPADTSRTVWGLANCNSPEALGACVATRPLPSEIVNEVDRSWPIRNASADTGLAPGYEVTFAPGWDGLSSTSSFTRDWNGAGVTSAVAQAVMLPSGYYRLSWYAREIDVNTDPMLPARYLHLPADAVALRTSSGVVVTQESGQRGDVKCDLDKTNGWSRCHFLFSVSADATYQVALVPAPPSTVGEHKIHLGGLMLEDVGDVVTGSTPVTARKPEDVRPGLYVATVQAGVATSAVCEDTLGVEFRQLWRRGCERLCPTGFASCDEGQFHCFWEFPFSVTMEGIERGGILRKAGFAYGNYNHRLDGVVVNFVGTGLRDCSQSLFPSSCYSSGNIPYTLLHNSPYTVRNHQGELYAAPLFRGRIEYGRGLAAERYVGNPISSADRTLLEPYKHGELRGRPITGNYVVRLWDTDGLNFNELRDVQVILDYRYWTRFSEK
jgi:hypothetical protein